MARGEAGRGRGGGGSAQAPTAPLPEELRREVSGKVLSGEPRSVSGSAGRPAASSRGVSNQRREDALELLCWRRRRRLPLTQHPWSSAGTARRARTRACDPSAAIGLGGSRERRGRLRRGRGGILLRDNHYRHVRTAKSGYSRVAVGGRASGPGPARRAFSPSHSALQGRRRRGRLGVPATDRDTPLFCVW